MWTISFNVLHLLACLSPISNCSTANSALRLWAKHFDRRYHWLSDLKSSVCTRVINMESEVTSRVQWSSDCVVYNMTYYHNHGCEAVGKFGTDQASSKMSQRRRFRLRVSAPAPAPWIGSGGSISGSGSVLPKHDQSYLRTLSPLDTQVILYIDVNNAWT